MCLGQIERRERERFDVLAPDELFGGIAMYSFGEIGRLVASHRTVSYPDKMP